MTWEVKFPPLREKMSKSIGNTVAPEEVIVKYGAEIIRLWVAASDYRDDIRISENILKQLSDAYRRIRNTSRFMLGNFFDFDPEKDAVPYESMTRVDRYILHTLQELTEKTIKAYDSFEFHIIYHALYNYCTLDLSAFYLDILKDRLYTSIPESQERRSAQTAMYILLDSMVRIMAPILAFTAEEIWKFMPELKDKVESVHLTQLPQVNRNWMDDELADQWENLREVRGEVTKALEESRTNKLIGHPLDAHVRLFVSGDLYEKLKAYEEDLRAIFIVSKVSLLVDGKPEGIFESDTMEGLAVEVTKANEDKCERCWIHVDTVGANPEHPAVCGRCLGTLEEMGLETG